MSYSSIAARAGALLATGALGLGLRALPAEPAEPQPDQSGPLKLTTASLLGGANDDEIVGTGFARDGSILLAGNAADLRLHGVRETYWTMRAAPLSAEPLTGGRRARRPGAYGFLLRLSPDGRTPLSLARFGYGEATLRGMRIDGDGGIHLLGDAAELRIGGVTGHGAFVVSLSHDGKRLKHPIFQPEIIDFGVDGNDELLLLSSQGLSRYSPDGRVRRWNATWPAYGRDRPGAVAVSPRSGIATVIGYGMAHTGREPYKDPYAYGFDRDGREIWRLWNPDPTREVSAKLGGNGLMADTTGYAASATADGRFLLSLFADGGNSICTRDPANPDRLLDPAVMEGAHQKTPGFGFRGASKTSVLFRVDPRTGRLEKGTWLSAWLNKNRANSLLIEDMTGAEGGETYVVGSSAAKCPAVQPWYPGWEGGYGGGGYLACFDAGFRLRQCGAFPTTSMECVAQRNGVVVIGGSAQPAGREGRPSTEHTPLFRALQREPGGGKDGFFAVFRQSAPA